MIEPISINEILEAKKRIADTITRTPRVKLDVEDAPAEIYLKLENLQPTGSFKIRGACNAIKTANPEDLKNGVWTISSGNHGQAVAWNAKQHGLKCTIYAMSIARALGSRAPLEGVPVQVEENDVKGYQR